MLSNRIHVHSEAIRAVNLFLRSRRLCVGYRQLCRFGFTLHYCLLLLKYQRKKERRGRKSTCSEEWGDAMLIFFVGVWLLLALYYSHNNNTAVSLRISNAANGSGLGVPPMMTVLTCGTALTCQMMSREQIVLSHRKYEAYHSRTYDMTHIFRFVSLKSVTSSIPDVKVKLKTLIRAADPHQK